MEQHEVETLDPEIPLRNAKHERFAVLVAKRVPPKMAYRRIWSNAAEASAVTSSSLVKRRPEVAARIDWLMQHGESREKDTELLAFQDVLWEKSKIIGTLQENILKAMAAVPVAEIECDACGHMQPGGVWKTEYNAANRGLELLGREHQMFQTTSNLNVRKDPLEGSREEILERIRILLDAFSADDLESIGYGRVGITIRAERAPQPAGPNGSEQAIALPAVSEASGVS